MMNENLGKIYSIEVKKGKIVEVCVYIQNPSKYTSLSGYGAPRTAYNIAEFKGEEAMKVILSDIGVEDIEFDITKANYGEYSRLSGILSNGARIRIDDKIFMAPKERLIDIKKITLDKAEAINEIKLYAGEDSGVVDISWKEYLFIYELWGDKLKKEELSDELKRKYVVVTHQNEAYNYYNDLESDKEVVVKNISTSEGDSFRGVFLVNLDCNLLKITAIEEGYCMTRDEIIPRGSTFYASANSITYMK